MDLNEAIRHLDLVYGEGFGKNNPELVVDYMKAYGLNNIEHQLKPVMDHLTQHLNGGLSERIKELVYAINQSYLEGLK